MQNYGVWGTTKNRIARYLTDKSQGLKLEEIRSVSGNIDCGGPQGLYSVHCYLSSTLIICWNYWTIVQCHRMLMTLFW